MNLLAVDIGNTNITLGLFRGRALSRVFNIPTAQYCLGKLKKTLGNAAVEDAIICSVVPVVTGKLAKEILKITGKRPYIIGKDITVPIKNLYRNPKQVGQDRLVNAYAATRLYNTPLIAIDFGTAVTFDIITRKKEYSGGMIIPGLRISLEALNRHTALLPKVKLEPPAEFIGKDTKTSMLSGIVFGFASLVKGLVEDIKERVGKGATVVLTGGNSRFIAGYLAGGLKLEPDLTLKGLNLIYENIICKPRA
jgi:type III pantothenate kinase